MESLEIVCESCDSRMRLSESLLGKIAGKSGRVTCRECQNKIVLNATEGEVRVTSGGYEVGALDLEEIDDFTEVPPSVDPHLSELPLEPVGDRSVPPPLPEEAGVPESFKVRTPGPDDVAAAMRFGRNTGSEFEAPAPDFGSDGSLSPHAMDEEDDGLVSLGREFNSSPFASERDASYNSLFPEYKPKAAPVAQEAPAPVISRAPSPPKRGELRRMKSDPEIFAGDLTAAPAVASTVVEMGPDGQLINQSDRKRRAPEAQRGGHWIPWTVAAIALLGLGVSVTVNRRPSVLAESTEAVAQPVVTQAASAPPAEVEEPASATVEEVADEASVTEPQDDVDAATKAAPVEAAPESQVLSAQPEKAEASSETPNAGKTRSVDAVEAASEPSATASEPSEADEADEEEAEEPALASFSATAASSALREATALASACRKPGDPTGTAKVVVTFAPSGRVTRAAVTGAPFAGTETGGCIASRFRTARVPAFSGEHVTVSKTVSIL